MIVLTARPDYSKQRLWQQEVKPGVRRANGLLSTSSLLKDVGDAIRQAYDRPGERSQFWLDGARHPHAFGMSPDGERAQAVRDNEKLHNTLILEARGVPARNAAQQLGGIRPEQIGERMAKIRGTLGARSSVQLGLMAAKLGLLDDIEDPDGSE